MIEVKQLVREFSATKGFGRHEKSKKVAVDHLSFSIQEGEIFSLLGPNGAGKTTTIKILSTLLAPTEGYCKVLGFDTFREAKKIRPYINFIFGGESGVYRRITGRENMEYFASLYKVNSKVKEKRIDDLLALVGLEEAQHNRVETYSKGMIQRLQIARGLINDPKILFMDEPTIGLDPIGSRDLRALILSLKEQGRTILLSTHDMREADILSDRIAVISKGKIIALDTPTKLKEKYALESVIEVDVESLEEVQKKYLKALKGCTFMESILHDGYVHVTIHYKDNEKMIIDVLKILENNKLLHFSERGTLLEDVYIRLIEGGKESE